VTDKKGNISFEPIDSAQPPSMATPGIMPMSPAIMPFNRPEQTTAKRGAKIKSSIGNGSVVKMFKM
jgi:hypothetical protein